MLCRHPHPKVHDLKRPMTCQARPRRSSWILLSRTILKHSLDIRELQSAVLRTLLANQDSDIVSAATSATQAHDATATELRRDNKSKELDNLAKPHVHLWGKSSTSHCAAGAQQGGITKAEKELLTQHLADATPSGLENKVLVARCKNCYDPRKMRFVILHVILPAMFP